MNFNRSMKTLISYRRVYKNYLGVLFKLYTNRNASLNNDDVRLEVMLKNGNNLIIPYGWVTAFVKMIDLENNNKNIKAIKLTEKGLSFRYKELPVIIDPGRFSDPYAVFFSEEYKSLEVKDKDVIDVGMNIGDSTIYFCLNGARRVIGMEPYPYAFHIAQRNMLLNQTSNVILLNAGYGVDSRVTVDKLKISSNSSELSTSIVGMDIPILSLKTLIDNYDIRNAVLKMDCEGCEYALIRENEDTLKKIEMMQIEYHYGFEKIEEKLEKCGFEVHHTEPYKVYNPDAQKPNMEVGYIYAQNSIGDYTL